MKQIAEETQLEAEDAQLSICRSGAPERRLKAARSLLPFDRRQINERARRESPRPSSGGDGPIHGGNRQGVLVDAPADEVYREFLPAEFLPGFAPSRYESRPPDVSHLGPRHTLNRMALQCYLDAVF